MLCYWFQNNFNKNEIGGGNKINQFDILFLLYYGGYLKIWKIFFFLFVYNFILFLFIIWNICNLIMNEN